MTRRRLAYTHSILHFGSTERYLLDLLEGLDPDRFEAWLIVPDDPALGPLLDYERVVALPKAAYASVPSTVRRLTRELRRLRPDLVHVVDVDPSALVAARLARVRRLVVTHHTPELPRRDNVVGRVLLALGWAMRPWTIFTSDRDLDRFGGARSVTIPLGIDLERFRRRDGDGRVRRELGLVDGEPLVGTVGLLKEQKRHDLLVSAAEAIDAAFVIVGAGPERAELEDQIRTFGLEARVFLLGHRDDVPEVLADLDVFALSSGYEGMCLAVAEALAVGTPVVATAVGGVPQTVVHEETGLLVPPFDAFALAEGIARLLRDRDEALKLAEAGGERVRRLYSLDGMVDATSALYARLLA
jgi:glycosyltransferase involved in cell wall biosynthesis